MEFKLQEQFRPSPDIDQIPDPNQYSSFVGLWYQDWDLWQWCPNIADTGYAGYIQYLFEIQIIDTGNIRDQLRVHLLFQGYYVPHLGSST